MINYTVFSTQEHSEYIGYYTGWGIVGRYADSSEAGRIGDISENRCYVEAVAEMLNCEDVEAVHLRDIIEDLLSMNP